MMASLLIPFALVAPTAALGAKMTPPTSFDCKMRKAAYSYGRHLLPRLGAFEPLYYALNLNDPNCKGELEALPASTESPSTPHCLRTLYM